jgi:uncharacterized membrane protein
MLGRADRCGRPAGVEEVSMTTVRPAWPAIGSVGPAGTRPAPPRAVPPRSGHRPLGVDHSGLAGAMVLFCLSTTPSLLPRSCWMQALAGGVLGAAGYLLGVAVHRTVRRIPGVGAAGPAPGLRRLLWSAGTVVTVWSVVYGGILQLRQYDALGLPRPPLWGYLVAAAGAVGVMTLLVAAARALRATARALTGRLGHRLPYPAARLTAVISVAALLLGVLPAGLFVLGDGAFRVVDARAAATLTAPTPPELSGSTASLVRWSTLGHWGRAFVTSGPSVKQLTAFNGRPARQPVRVYVGLAAAPSLRSRVDLAVRELQRTGAFQRRILCVVTTTGTGWVDRRSVSPLEYMHNGDTATVAVQYSYLPSALSFVAVHGQAERASRELTTAVARRWAQMPPGHRPRLVVFGESLGAFGAAAAFTGVPDIERRVDAALFIGPPTAGARPRRLVAGGTATAPRSAAGSGVRGANGQPSAPPVVYLRHDSDPVVRWSPRLLLIRPEWLGARRPVDVPAAVRWLPLVTFVQVTVDLASANRMPPGNGHNYRGEAVDAWVLLVKPPGWTAAQTVALRTLMRR